MSDNGEEEEQVIVDEVEDPDYVPKVMDQKTIADNLSAMKKTAGKSHSL